MSADGESDEKVKKTEEAVEKTLAIPGEGKERKVRNRLKKKEKKERKEKLDRSTLNPENGKLKDLKDKTIEEAKIPENGGNGENGEKKTEKKKKRKKKPTKTPNSPASPVKAGYKPEDPKNVSEEPKHGLGKSISSIKEAKAQQSIVEGATKFVMDKVIDPKKAKEERKKRMANMKQKGNFDILHNLSLIDLHMIAKGYMIPPNPNKAEMIRELLKAGFSRKDFDQLGIQAKTVMKTKTKFR